MKFLIASDIHGSAYYTKKLISAFEREGAEKLVLLGDIYNHGPRNPLPEEYAPLKVAELLNGIKDKLIVIQGNCDSQVDTLISEFDFVDNSVLVSGEKTVFCTHGHIYNQNSMPKTKFDVVIYGHFHTGFIKEEKGVIIVNAGSVSLPKDNTKNSYVLINDGCIFLKDLDGNIIDKI